MEDVLSLHEAAEKLGVTYAAVSSLLKRYPEIKEKYTWKTKYKGRLKTVISTEGMTVLANVKDGNRGSRYAKIKPGLTFQEGKQKIAEKAIEASRLTPAQFLLKQAELMVGLESQQLQNTKDIQEIKHSRDEAAKYLTEAPVASTKPKEKTVRTMIRQRVNAYCKATGARYDEIWGKLYKELYYRYRCNASTKAKGSVSREREVRRFKEIGYKEWAKQKEYGMRWATEAKFSSVKRKFGEYVRSTGKKNMIEEARRKFILYEKMMAYAEA